MALYWLKYLLSVTMLLIEAWNESKAFPMSLQEDDNGCSDASPLSLYPSWSTSGGCTCHSPRMTCVQTIPRRVPRGILHVELKEAETLLKAINAECLFCDYSWTSVETLFVFGTGVNSHQHVLYGHMFQNLSYLINLRISLPRLDRSLPETTFIGLDNVTTLDMSDCSRLSTAHLFNALQDKDVLPKLSKLVLHNTNTINYRTNAFTANISKILSYGRNISELDLSNTGLADIYSDNFEPLCKTLKVLNLSNAYAMNNRDEHENIQEPVCKSLETLDLSGFIPWQTLRYTSDITYAHVNFSATYHNYTLLLFLKNVKTVYMRNLNPMTVGSYSYIYNSVLDLSIVAEWKHIYLSENKLKYMDLLFVSDYIRLESLDLSYNDMEYVAPRIFQQSIMTSLKWLDLSHNMLNHMESKDLEILLSYLSKVEVLNLSFNNLSTIPSVMFEQNTNLQRVDVSNNRLATLMFKLDKLINLRYIDISRNLIKYLDDSTIQMLNNIYFKQNLASTDRLKVNIHHNILSCISCADLAFVKWMTSTPIIDSADNAYFCQSENGDKTRIDENVVRSTQTICDWKAILLRTLLIATVTSVTVVAIFVITIRHLVKRIRRKRIIAHVQERKRHIETDTYEFKYPIFLSYSSLDDDIVLNHLLAEFHLNLRATCRTDRELICFGDRHFRAGRWIFDEIVRCQEISGLLVVVMSRNYCDSQWCMAELQQAYQLHKPMLLICIEHVQETDMHAVLRECFRNQVRVKFGRNNNGDYEISPGWDNVCSSILEMLS